MRLSYTLRISPFSSCNNHEIISIRYKLAVSCKQGIYSNNKLSDIYFSMNYLAPTFLLSISTFGNSPLPSQTLKAQLPFNLILHERDKGKYNQGSDYQILLLYNFSIMKFGTEYSERVFL